MICLPRPDADPPSDMLLDDFLRDRYEPSRLLGKSSATIRSYRYCVRLFSRELGRPALLSDLTDQTIAAALSNLLKRKAATASVNAVRRTVVALANFAWRKRYIPEAPEITRLREVPPPATAWTVEEMGRLLAAVDTVSPRPTRGVPGIDFWRALLLTLYYTGLRITATLSLRGIDLDRNTGLLHARSDTQKNGRSMQFILPRDCLDALERILPADPMHTIFRPVSYGKTLRKTMHTILATAGLPNDSRCLFHKIRRTTAKISKANGGNATAILDHSSVRLTEDRYTGREPLDMRFMPCPGVAVQLPAALQIAKVTEPTPAPADPFSTFTTYTM